jgi:hypothetical protein
MIGDLWPKELIHISLECATRCLFVDLAQAAIASDVSDQNGCKTALHASPRKLYRDDSKINGCSRI